MRLSHHRAPIQSTSGADTRCRCRRETNACFAQCVGAPLSMHGSMFGLRTIDFGRIEQLVGIDERQSRPTLACIDLAIKAGTTAGVAGPARLLDPDPDGVLISIHPHVDDPRRRTFSPT